MSLNRPVRPFYAMLKSGMDNPDAGHCQILLCLQKYRDFYHHKRDKGVRFPRYLTIERTDTREAFSANVQGEISSAKDFGVLPDENAAKSKGEQKA